MSGPLLDATRSACLDRVAADGTIKPIERTLAVEAPIAIEVNGIGYAVLMATPADLTDLAFGFLLSERLVDGADDVIDVALHTNGSGTILRATVSENVAARIVDRVRHRASDSACGLCGIENLEQAMRSLPPVTRRWRGDPAAVFAAREALAAHQPLNAQTGAVHAAARCTADGRIVDVREDVGRHNALDKLIGAMLRAGDGWNDGFALVSSRCSYELVEKAVLSGCPMLATISAPTSLAIERARAAGLTLFALARSDAVLMT